MVQIMYKRIRDCISLLNSSAHGGAALLASSIGMGERGIHPRCQVKTAAGIVLPSTPYPLQSPQTHAGKEKR